MPKRRWKLDKSWSQIPSNKSVQRNENDAYNQNTTHKKITTKHRDARQKHANVIYKCIHTLKDSNKKIKARLPDVQHQNATQDDETLCTKTCQQCLKAHCSTKEMNPAATAWRLEQSLKINLNHDSACMPHSLNVQQGIPFKMLIPEPKTLLSKCPNFASTGNRLVSNSKPYTKFHNVQKTTKKEREHSTPDDWTQLPWHQMLRDDLRSEKHVAFRSIQPHTWRIHHRKHQWRQNASTNADNPNVREHFQKFDGHSGKSRCSHTYIFSHQHVCQQNTWIKRTKQTSRLHNSNNRGSKKGENGNQESLKQSNTPSEHERKDWTNDTIQITRPWRKNQGWWQQNSETKVTSK